MLFRSKSLKPLLRQDKVAVIVIERLPLTAACFDGSNCAGPVPSLFSGTYPANAILSVIVGTLIRRDREMIVVSTIIYNPLP